jgi:hypothetical protein
MLIVIVLKKVKNCKNFPILGKVNVSYVFFHIKAAKNFRPPATSPIAQQYVFFAWLFMAAVGFKLTYV